MKRQRTLVGWIAVIILCYIIVSVTYGLFGKRKIDFFEVHTVEINKDIYKNTLIVREEQLLKAREAGHILFYVNNFDKVGQGDMLYFSDPDGGFQELIRRNQPDREKLPPSVKDEIGRRIKTLSNSRDEPDLNLIRMNRQVLHDVYFSNLTEEQLLPLIQSYRKEHPLTVVESEMSGIFVNIVDGDEGLSTDKLTTRLFDDSETDSHIFLPNTKAKPEQPLGKLITSEYWSVIFPVSEAERAQFNEDDICRVRFPADNREGSGTIKHRTVNGEHYIELQFSQGVIRYAGLRKMPVSIPQQSLRGLRVPKESIAKQENLTGVYVLNSGLPTFYPVQVLAEDGNYQIVLPAENTSTERQLKAYDRILPDAGTFQQKETQAKRQ
ncbi:MAG: HlyD family efflux transporter periplasmic adaptor subunit [Eubacteriales bacterium]|nr:HlyD family efflux transporter periplasmic adaptor subunit [Eubacteriales bacterium]